MAEVAALAAAAPMAAPATQEAMTQFKEFWKYNAEVMARETTSFDYEKVFLQTIYGEALFFIFKCAYHLYEVMKYTAFVATHPLPAVESALSGLPFFGDVIDKIDELWDDAVITDAEWHDMWMAEKAKDPVFWFKPVFQDYWIIFMFAIPAILAAMEKRRVDKLRRKSRIMLKAFGR